MASSVIGALRVNLGIDSAQFSKGLKEADTRIASFAKSAAAGFAAVAAAATAAAYAMGTAIRGVINDADELAKMSQKIGISVEELSRFKYMADLSGMSLESFATGVRRLSTTISEAFAGKATAATQTLKNMGIEVRNADGTMRSANQVLYDLADRFSRMKDGAEKTAIAVQLLGRSGTEMIPMLNGGSAALRQMSEEADRFGIVIDTQTAQAAERFNDTLTRLGAVKEGIYTIITARLLPALEWVAEELLGLASAGEGAISMADTVVGAFETVIRGGVRLITFLRRLKAEAIAAWEALKLIAQGEFSAALDTMKNAVAETAVEWEKADQSVTELFTKSPDQRISQAFDAIGESAARTNEKVKDLSNVLAASGAGGGGGGKKGGGGGGSRGLSEAQRVWEATRTPLEKLNLEIEKLNNLFAKGAIDFDTYQRAISQAQDEFDRLGKKSNEIGKSVESSFERIIDSAIDGTLRLGDAIASLLRDLAKVLAHNAFKMIMGGGSGGGGLGSLFGGLFGSLPGFATGGSFKVGGAGGIDSQVVAFRATPGETVDIRKPGNDNGPGGNVNVQVGVTVDDDGKIRAYVMNAGQQAAHAGAAMAVRQVRSGLPSMMVEAQARSL